MINVTRALFLIGLALYLRNWVDIPWNRFSKEKISEVWNKNGKWMNPWFLVKRYQFHAKAVPRKLEVPRSIEHGSISELREYLPLSLISLCPTQTIYGFDCISSKSFKEVTIISGGSFGAAVTVAAYLPKKLLIVSYRPTVSAKNLESFSDYSLFEHPDAPQGVQVHAGFFEHFLSTKIETLEAVNKIINIPEYQEYTFHITGYSLGSAMATLSLSYWSEFLKAKGDRRNVQAFVYAGPRVGNEKFAQFVSQLNLPLTRYTNQYDVVSHLPPRSLGFTHVGVEFHEVRASFLGKSKVRSCSQEYDEDPSCGWDEKFPISLFNHLFPLGRFPYPPYS